MIDGLYKNHVQESSPLSVGKNSFLGFTHPHPTKDTCMLHDPVPLVIAESFDGRLLTHQCPFRLSFSEN